MKSDNLVIGKQGEELAYTYLRKNNYEIIDVNYRSKYAEIDIIAQKKDVLVFVEVKTCTDTGKVDPEELLHKRKMNKLKKNATVYAAINKYNGPLRIDAVCIVLTAIGKVKRLTHYKNITA